MYLLNKRIRDMYRCLSTEKQQATVTGTQYTIASFAHEQCTQINRIISASRWRQNATGYTILVCKFQAKMKGVVESFYLVSMAWRYRRIPSLRSAGTKFVSRVFSMAGENVFILAFSPFHNKTANRLRCLRLRIDTTREYTSEPMISWIFPNWKTTWHL